VRKSVRALTYIVTAGAALGIGTAIGSASSSGKTSAAPAPSVVSSPSTAAATQAVTSAAPAPIPSPDGTFQGACDYTLGDNPSGGTAVATGDVDVTNTGNIGGVFTVSISWPQQGYDPLKMTKTVKIPAGGENDVQFHMPLTGTQLDNLQNYQTGHDFDSGCKYDATITDTYGAAT
jgi:hypothetical protein